MLWGEDELALIVGCLGVSCEAAERVRGHRLKGAVQLLEMPNSQMAEKLGLVSPLKRLVVRRALHHLVEADRWENATRGRKMVDVLTDPALCAHLLPFEDLERGKAISRGGFGTVYRALLRERSAASSRPAGSPGTSSREKPGSREKPATTPTSYGGAVSSRATGDRGQEQRRPVAVKEMLGDQRARLHELLKEAHVMSSLSHPNICQFIGVCAERKPQGRRYIVSELLDCSLFDLLHALM
jgi:hypothetical protein